MTSSIETLIPNDVAPEPVHRLVLTQQALFTTVQAHLAMRRELGYLITSAEQLVHVGTILFNCGPRTGSFLSVTGLDCFRFVYDSNELDDPIASSYVKAADLNGQLPASEGMVRHPGWECLNAGAYDAAYLDQYDARTKMMAHQFIVIDKMIPDMALLQLEIADVMWAAGRKDVVFIIV